MSPRMAQSALDVSRIAELVANDMRGQVERMDLAEVRVLCRWYHDMQRERIRYHNEMSAYERQGVNLTVARAVGRGYQILEQHLGRVLAWYARVDEACGLLMRVQGIGPVLAASLLAYADPRRMRSDKLSSYWRFCGLDPTADRPRPGQKLPYSRWAKRTYYLCSDQFVRRPDSYYGEVYRRWKAEYERRNEAGMYADLARQELRTRSWRRDTQSRRAYEQGRLPQGRIDLRARRKAAKLFASHAWEVIRRSAGLPCRRPWIVSTDGRHEYIPPPASVWGDVS